MAFNPALPYATVSGGEGPAVYCQDGVYYERDGTPASAPPETMPRPVMGYRGADGIVRAFAEGLDVLPVVSVRQGAGSDLVERPAADIVHWYAMDRVLYNRDYPYDQFFPSGFLRLFDRGQQGAALAPANAAVIGDVALESAISKVLDASANLNDVSASGAAKPLRAGRVNLLNTTTTLSGWTKPFAGTGVAAVVTPAAGIAPDGTNTAIRVDFDCVNGSSTANRSMLSSTAITCAVGASFASKLWVKAATPADVGKTIYVKHEQSTEYAAPLVTLTAEWTALDRTFTKGASGTTTNYLIETRGTYTSVAASALLWQPEIRYSVDAALPAQPVVSASDYATDGMPIGAKFDGTDDCLTSAAGGGSTSAFYLCASFRAEQIGAAATLWSDAGTNAGYRLRQLATGYLEFSAGNGSTFVAVQSGRVVGFYERVRVAAWHDGANIYLRINDETATSTALVTATAGTAGVTIGKANGAASEFFKGTLYAAVHFKDALPAINDRADIETYCGAKARL